MESLSLQIEALHDRLHVAQLARHAGGPALALPALLPPPQPPSCSLAHAQQQQQQQQQGASGERMLQAQVAELTAQNLALKAAAARLARGLSEAMGGGGGGCGSGAGRGGAATVLSELTAAERILEELDGL